MARKRTYLVKDFLSEFDWAVKNFYVKQGRGFEQFLHGASVHFHERLIAIVRRRGGYPARWIGEEPYFVELLYAMLASWGMDSQRARLVDFAEFEGAVHVLLQSRILRHFEGVAIKEIDNAWRDRLRELWDLLGRECRIMVGASIMVGSSKLLHHIVPDAFPPMDGSYTLDFLSHLAPTEVHRINSSQAQRPDFETFYKGMLFFGMVSRKVRNIDKYVGARPMSGSVPKVIDNAIVAWWATK
jgi:hypothetical protein